MEKYKGADGYNHFESDAEFEQAVRELMPEYQHSFFYED